MADQLDPQDIARASFGIARRGYEQQAVRGFLHEVSALVDRLNRSGKELREQLQRAEARIGSVEQPDEATLLEMLGAETTRVLTSAHEAAADLRAKAEVTAARIIGDATSEAASLREVAAAEVEALVAHMTAETEALRDAARNELELRRAEAHAAAQQIHEAGQEAARVAREEGKDALARAHEDAVAVVEAAQQQGRDMVAEARAVRERVLRDLAVRRKRARQQVEKLNAGRERLLSAYDTVRATLNEATTELNVSLTDARVAANAAARRVDEEPEMSLEQLDAEVAAAGLADLPIAELDDEDDDLDDAGSGPLSGEVPAIDGARDDQPDNAARVVSVAEEPTDVPVGETRTISSLDERRGRKSRRRRGFEGLPPSELAVLEPPSPEEGVRVLVEVVEDAGVPQLVDDPEVEPEPPPDPAVVAESAPEPELGPDPVADIEAEAQAEPAAMPEHHAADDVFARLREQAEPVEASAPQVEPTAADPVAGDESPAPEPEPAEGRPDDVTSSAFTRRAEAVAPIDKELRRRLKRALADEQNEVLDLLRRAKPKGVDDLLPATDVHASRWAEAVAAVLTDGAAAGAASLGGTPGSVTALVEELAHALTAPLRERIERSFVASDGDLEDVADRVRALYREWKGQRLSEAAEHYSLAAYASGVRHAIDPGAKVRWVIDVSVGACPDCDDNVLAGAITNGDDFPTGSPGAPAHPGCHCLVLPENA